MPAKLCRIARLHTDIMEANLHEHKQIKNITLHVHDYSLRRLPMAEVSQHYCVRCQLISLAQYFFALIILQSSLKMC